MRKRTDYGKVFLLICILAQSACNPISDNGWESGGTILFVHKQNPNLLILEQLYRTGAWDGGVTTRVALKNLEESTIENIDTAQIDRTAWIQIRVKVQDWDFSGSGFYDGELNTISELGDSIFRHQNLTEFKRLLLPIDEYKLLSGSKRYYSIQEYSDEFNAYVNCSGGGLVLQTVDFDNKGISSLELYRRTEGGNFSYYKYAEFDSRLTFDLTKEYLTFRTNEIGETIPESTIKITFNTRYVITREGEIRKISEEEFGKIEIVS